jgi:hypothetical protein
MNSHRACPRTGLTLTELLVASIVTALLVVVMSSFTLAVLEGWDEATRVGDATQAGRVITSRIAHKVETSLALLKMSDALRSMAGMDQVLMIWERDDQANDPLLAGSIHFNELVIYARSKTRPNELWEIRPQVDPTLEVPENEPATVYAWIDRFRSGQNISPPVVLISELGGVHFDVEEYAEPQGIGGVVQRNVRIGLSVAPAGQPATIFLGSTAWRGQTPRPTW